MLRSWTSAHCTKLLLPTSARAGNRRFLLLSALRAHTKAPYKNDLHGKTLTALKRPGGRGQVPVIVPFISLGGRHVVFSTSIIPY